MQYHIEISLEATKSLKRIPRADQRRIAQRIQSLGDDPRPPGSRKLQGMNDAYRVRQGDYRIISMIQEAIAVVSVTKIGHRRDMYR